MMGHNERFLNATTQWAIQASRPDMDEVYQSLAISVMKALAIRSCLVAARDPENKLTQVPKTNVRMGMHLPDNSLTLGSHYILTKRLQPNLIANNVDGPHLSMHSIAAWSGDQIVQINGIDDPKVQLLMANRKALLPNAYKKERFRGKWANKVMWFVNWHDDHPVPLCSAMFGSQFETCNRIQDDLQSQEWSDFYTLVQDRINERQYSPIELDDISERDREILECIALYPDNVAATKLGITHKSYRRRRSILANRFGVTPKQLPAKAVEWTLAI